MITDIIFFLIVIIFICEFSTSIVYGWFMKNSDVLFYIKSTKRFNLNQFNDEIISRDIDWSNEELVRKKLQGPADFISTVPISIFSKYYIANIGRVFRWSEGHREIEILFKTLKSK